MLLSIIKLILLKKLVFSPPYGGEDHFSYLLQKLVQGKGGLLFSS